MLGHQPNQEPLPTARKGGCDALGSLGQKPSKQHSWELAAFSQNQTKSKDFPSAHKGFSKLVLALYSKAISFGCSQLCNFYIFVCFSGSFCCLAGVGYASALAVKQKQESWLYPDTEFVQTCTVLDDTLRHMI